MPDIIGPRSRHPAPSGNSPVAYVNRSAPPAKEYDVLIPVILSGGSGSRLWPVSREASPKPFMKVGDGGTLLRMTYDRACALKDVAEIVTVTNREHYFQTRDECGKGLKGTI